MNRGGDLVNHWMADLKVSGWQGFVYISDAVVEPLSQADLLPDLPEHPLKARVFPLSTMQVGDRVRIVSLNCGESNHHLMGMGLMPDVILEVISCTATGSVIVALQNQRLGLGAEMTQRIQVINATLPLVSLQLPPQQG
jgi:ferrous iron transport protein A